MRALPLEETLLALQDCLCSAIAEAVGAEGSMVKDVCLCSVISGDSIPLDYCGPGTCGDRCGMAWVRLVGIQVLETAASVPGCAVPLQALIEVGIARCSLTMVDDNMGLPGADEHLAETLAMLDDFKILRKAIGCCPQVKTALTDYSPFGPEGGCIGGAFNLVVDIL